MKRTWIGRHNYHRAHCKAPYTPNLPKSYLNVTSLGEWKQHRHYIVHVFTEVPHTHVQNAPLEWFLSSPRLGPVARLLSETWWLHIRLMDIRGPR